MTGDRSVYIRYIYDCICYVEAYIRIQDVGLSSADDPQVLDWVAQ